MLAPELGVGEPWSTARKRRRGSDVTDLLSIGGTEADVSAEDLDPDAWCGNHPAAPQSEADTRPDVSTTDLRDRPGFCVNCSSAAGALQEKEHLSPCPCLHPGRGR